MASSSIMKFRITDRVNSFFTQCKAEDKLPDDLVIEIDSAVKKGYITVNLLTKINKNLKCDDSVDIKDLLKGSSLIFVDNKPKIEESAEVVKRREYLKMKQEQKEYNMMVHGTTHAPESSRHNRNQENPYTTIKNQVTVSANMIVSVFVMFGIGYYMGGGMSNNETTKMVCGLVASIGIMIVEMTLFILRAVRMENAFENKKDK